MNELEIKEINRQKTVYQWRCSPDEKRQLLTQAAKENRTANKVLSEALQMYLRAHGRGGSSLT